MEDNELIVYRSQIDEIDNEIAKLFEERMKVVTNVAKYKKENNLPILDSNRENKILEKVDSRIKDEKIKKYYIKLIKTIFELSKEYENEVL